VRTVPRALQRRDGARRPYSRLQRRDQTAARGTSTC